jgi:hypothetical protein
LLAGANQASLSSLKHAPQDPFKNTLMASQYFSIDGTKDQVVEGKNGTVIVCPQGSFLTMSGEAVTGPIKLELAFFIRVESANIYKAN